MAKNITYQLQWTASVVAVPIGAGSMEVPSAQVLTVNPFSTSGGGRITISSTGDYPTSSNISTAATTAGTNIAAALNANLSQLQGFNSGGG